MQRLEVLFAMMLSRERMHAADGVAADGCMPLAAALAALPSGLIEMVADSVAALGCAHVPSRLVKRSMTFALHYLLEALETAYSRPEEDSESEGAAARAGGTGKRRGRRKNKGKGKGKGNPR